jgi:integrase
LIDPPDRKPFSLTLLCAKVQDKPGAAAVVVNIILAAVTNTNASYADSIWRKVFIFGIPFFYRQIYPFILIGLRTGMRKSEILSIRRDNVDLAARSIYVPHAKAGDRTQPISPDLAKFLAQYMQTLPPGTEWLFPSPGARKGHTVDVRKAFVRCVAAAGLDPKRYAHQSGTHIADALEKLDDRYRISKRADG